MSSFHLNRRVDWGHAVLVLFLAALTVFYLADAYEASPRVRNLILVLPASIVSLTLCAVIGVGIIGKALSRDSEFPSAGETVASGRPLPERFRTGILIGLFALYILTLPTLGFDLGSLLFMVAALLAEGERSPIVLVGIPLTMAAAVTLGFRYLLPYPMPTLLF